MIEETDDEIEDEPDTEIDEALHQKILERLSQIDQAFSVDIDDLLGEDD
jgi:hypothetical protein